MPITLTPEIEAWIQAHVATGDFASIEEAARQLIAERIAERAAQEASCGEPTREALWVGELSDDEIAAIATTKMDARHRHLDNELR